MKSNELRVGNLFDFTIEDLGYLPIEEIRKDSDGFNGYYAVFRNGSVKRLVNEDVMPTIPLAEEWLIKFGMTLHLRTDRCVVYTMPHTKLNLVGESKCEIVVELSTVLPMEDMRFCMVGIRVSHNSNNNFAWVKHLHELQNAVYFSSGEELTIQ